MLHAARLIFEIIGTIAFAISGAMLAIHKHMDALGVTILGLTTATGGGIVRDLLIGTTPPSAFTDPRYAIIAIVTSIVVFIPYVRRAFDLHEKGLHFPIHLMDTLGLGVFTVVGVAIAHETIPNASFFMAVFVSTVGAVGGGVMRDMMAGTTPFIFVKHFYACAVLIGAMVCEALWAPLGDVVAMTAGAVVVIILRLLAAHYHWQLPRA